MPRRGLQIEADEPAIEQIVLELLHELPLAPDRVEQRQQQRAQQLLGRNRRAARLAIERLELRREIAQDGIHELSNGPQRVIGRHPLLEHHRRKHRPLYALVSPHRSPLAEVAPVYKTAGVTPEGTPAFSASC